MIRRLLKRVFEYIYGKELRDMRTEMSLGLTQLNVALKQVQKDSKRVESILSNFDVSVDVHTYSSSWAVLSLQGNKTDYIKFLDLEDRDLREIARFLERYDRRNCKVDANPNHKLFIERYIDEGKRY